jgi:LysM repeat protein
MPYRSPARWLAPLALIAALAATLLVATGSSESGDDPAPAATVPTAGTTPAAAGTGRKRKPRRTYTVRPGDVLSVIAGDNGLTVERLEELNPGVDAQSLTPGQKLKLSP